MKAKIWFCGVLLVGLLGLGLLANTFWFAFGKVPEIIDVDRGYFVRRNSLYLLGWLIVFLFSLFRWTKSKRRPSNPSA